MKSENVKHRGKEDKRLHMDPAARNPLAAASLVCFHFLQPTFAHLLDEQFGKIVKWCCFSFMCLPGQVVKYVS